MKQVVQGFFLLGFLTTFQFQAHALDHYCQDPSTVGRAIYICQAALGIRTSLTTVEDGLNILKSIRSRPLKRECREKCIEECNNGVENQDENNGIPGNVVGIEPQEEPTDSGNCVRDCRNACYASTVASMMSKVSNGINIYESQCDLSRRGQPCERREARRYCKRRRVREVRRYLPPKNPTELVRLRKAYRKISLAFEVRDSDLETEKEEMREQTKNDINDKLECPAIPDGTSICSMAGIANEDPKSLIAEFATITALRFEQNKLQVCNKDDSWKGCAQSTSCGTDRDDIQHRDPLDGKTCYCDEICCQQGFNDCCSNAESQCPVQTGLAFCRLDTTTTTLLKAFGGLERYRDLFEE